MVKLVSAKCPSCGATLKLSKEEEKVKCEYCHNTIIVDDAIACYKLKISGNVSVDGVTTNADLIELANELLDMNEYLKAKRKFLEFSEKCPDNYQGWLGLLICRTRNFTIRDNNIMFENDVNKYREHFFRVAPQKIKEQYFEVIDRYFDPEKYKRIEKLERLEKIKKQLEEQKKQAEEKRKLAEEEQQKKKKLAEAEKLKRKQQIEEEIIKKKDALLESSSYKALTNAGNKFKMLFLAAWNGFLYFIGGVLILAYLFSLTEDFISSFFAILFGLSLFKFVYVFIKSKFPQLSEKKIKIARIIIPFLILIIWMMCTPIENTEQPTTNDNTNNTVDNSKNTLSEDKNQNINETSKKVTYYIKYNELGEFGRNMEFEKKNVIFYYLPDGKYQVELTKLNENVCYLWIDYREGYQNGNYGTAYNTKERLKFSKKEKKTTIEIDSSVHIYNSNDCNYKFTLIN